MEGGLLSLRWNDHSHTFFDMLSTIRRKESYCDVTLVSDGRFYPVHKLVLSTCSDFFDNLFSRTDCKHPVVIVANVSHKDLEALLNYMYLGEVNVLQTELGNLMKAAEVLKIKGLAEPTKSTTKDKDRHHKSFSESFDSSTKRKRVEDSSGPSSKRSQCTGKPDSTESARSRVSSDLQTLSKDSDHGAILPIPSSSNTDPKECLTRTVYDQKGSREDDSSEKAIRPEVKVEEIMVKDEPGSWFNENDESGTNVSYSETDSNIEYSNQTVDYSNSCVPWELPTAAQPHLMESHLPQGMPGASGMQAIREQLIDGSPGASNKITRGLGKIYVAGFAYTKNRSSGIREYWRCQDRRCPGRLVLHGREVIKIGVHVHPPETGGRTSSEIIIRPDI
ncbi:zinc finger and BTB domain-containing protein 17-like isoform X4 [Macrobrachium nipponense]|uniref:zinc finger and BTB domain-containing protein 17-like isoform X4 n=1 Tax=Macrobrachium nipponense TaxID=159736 RepID=UPI0030C88ED8